MYTRFLLLFLSLRLLTPPLPAQTVLQDSVLLEEDPEEKVWEESTTEYTVPPATPAPPVSPVSIRPISEQRWKEASGVLDYSDERKPKPPKPSRPITPKSPSLIDWQGLGQFGGNLVQVILIGLAVLGIAYGIFHMLRQPGNRTLQRASDGVIITEANLDQYLQETDLQRFLRAALESGNYALAIRLYYLQIIKTLSERRAIAWSKEKTNRDYLREMRHHPQHDAFRQATRTFERVWYGNSGLQAEEYARLETQFSTLLNNL